MMREGLYIGLVTAMAMAPVRVKFSTGRGGNQKTQNFTPTGNALLWFGTPEFPY